jgi:hypothetical protein
MKIHLIQCNLFFNWKKCWTKFFLTPATWFFSKPKKYVFWICKKAETLIKLKQKSYNLWDFSLWKTCCTNKVESFVCFLSDFLETFLQFIVTTTSEQNSSNNSKRYFLLLNISNNSCLISQVNLNSTFLM